MEMPSTTSKLAEDRLKLYKNTLARATLRSSEVPVTNTNLFGKDFSTSPLIQAEKSHSGTAETQKLGTIGKKNRSSYLIEQ